MTTRKDKRGYFFVYNGVSSKQFNIGIKTAPIRTIPERRVNTIEVPFRDGSFTLDTGTYGTFTIDFECLVVGSFTPQHIRKIKRWLSEPFGKLQVSDELELEYEAKMINKVDFEELVDNTGSFLVTFECQPYGHYRQGLCLHSVSNNTEIHNETDTIALPYMKIYGSGDITVTLNGEPITFKGVSEYIEVDSELMECFKDNSLLNDKMIGNFPIFRVGVNTIVSNASKIDILPRWRAL